MDPFLAGTFVLLGVAFGVAIGGSMASRSWARTAYKMNDDWAEFARHLISEWRGFAESLEKKLMVDPDKIDAAKSAMMKAVLTGYIEAKEVNGQPAFRITESGFAHGRVTALTLHLNPDELTLKEMMSVIVYGAVDEGQWGVAE